MRRDLSIAIIGGSLVGPATALLLQKAGFTDVTVYEAMSQAQSRSGGIMGLRYPTLEALSGVGIDQRTIVALRDKNTYAYDIEKGGVPVSRGMSDFPGLVTSWDALHDQLKSKVDVKYRHELVSWQGTEEGVILFFNNHNGEQALSRHADLVLFADGRKSFGRTLLDPLRESEYQGYVVWRGLATPPRPVPTGFNRYFDAAGSRLFSITGPILQSGLSYWELSHNLSADNWETLAGGRPEDKAYLLPHKIDDNAKHVIDAAMAHLPGSFRNLVSNSEISGIPINDTRMPDRAAFQVGNAWAVLLGDALIPVRLQVGAGLNQGLLQAQDLVRWLDSDENDIYNLMNDWEANTLEVLARWVELGRSRVGRLNLGHYTPVRPGWTAVPETDNAFDTPKWVLA